MDNANYMTVVMDAFSKLEKFYCDRESIDGEIMKTEQFIAAAANMLPDNARDLAIRRIEVLQELYRLRDAGLTDAIRAILKTAAGDWLTVTNVRDRLSKAGFDFSSYSANPLASISAILRRMKSEEVETTLVDGGVAAYRWKDTSHLIKFSPEFLKTAMKAMQKNNK
jgi:hypothetical protein